VSARTFAIGDIHGDLRALDRLLRRLPRLTARDTLVFLGDYVDRGLDSRGVIERVQELQRTSPAKIVALRGNHEDKWIECYREPDLGFLIPSVNGCGSTFRSYASGPFYEPLYEEGALSPAELGQLVQVSSWMPREVIDWMESLPLWYEDDHAVYVHAGIDGKKGRWKHPSDSDAVTLLWQRRWEFYTGYRGKRLLFGHTAVDELPNDHLGPYASYQATLEVWMRGDLIGMDTACGKGGHLSAIELPSSRIFDSRESMLQMVGDDTPIMPVVVAAS
jgi:serine/threonine protein phosphatase 1